MRITCYLILLSCISCIHAIAQVHAEFTADQKSGCGVVQVNFRNQSTGSITSYSWDFGTGVSSSAIHPSKVYITPGVFKVCLTVTDSAGLKDTNCKLDYIKVNSNYVANFKATESVICAGTETSFEDATNSPNGKIVSWIWDLNGSAGVVQQDQFNKVTSRYDIAGKYFITLHVTDEAGCRAIISKPLLTVIPTPTVNINVPVNTVCDTIGQVIFKNTSSNSSEISYEWEFGNGEKYEGFEPPPITYQGIGSYDVHVTAIHLPTGCKTEKDFPKAVIVADLAPFTNSKSVVCANESLTFNPINGLNVDSHLWDFGDGSTSTAISPSHSFSKAGIYLVKHRIENKGCSSERVSTDSIKVNELPTVGYKLNDTAGCMLPLKIVTSNQSEGAINFSWTANGVQISTEQQPILEFPNEGIFKVGLLTTNEYGCTAFIEHKTVHAYKVKPILSSQMVRACAPLNGYALTQNSTSIDPISQVTWTIFTPIPKVINSFNSSINITDTGSFKLQLRVQNEVGCVDSVDYDHWIQLGLKPITGMKLPKFVCYGHPIQILDNSSNFANEFYWGKGLSANLAGTKTFQFENDQLGTIIISHQVSQYGCPGSLITDSITVNGARAQAEAQLVTCAEPLQRIFINKSEGADSVHWDFGVIDSTSDISDSIQPIFTYPVKGNYTVRFNVFNKASGCPPNSDTLQIEIKEVKASFTLDHKEGCVPQDISITNLSEDAVKYRFDLLGSDKKSSTEVNPIFRFSNGGITQAVLIATDIDGCSDTTRIDSISIHQSIAQITPLRAIFCQDSTLTLFNQSRAINDSIKKISWTYAQMTVADQDTIHVSLDTLNTPKVSIKIETLHGCGTDTELALPVNKIKATIQTDTIVCVKDIAIFRPDITGRWNHILWDFGDGTFSQDTLGQHRFKSNGLYKIKATISDDLSHCIDTFSFPHVINVGDPQALFTISTDNSNCRPLIAKFKNNSKLVDKFEWNLGDLSGRNFEINPSHLYTRQGYFDVMLIAKSSELCRDTLIIDSAIFVTGPIINIEGNVDHTACLPLNAKYDTKLTNTKHALMEWGDGAQDTLIEKAGKQVFEHKYQKPGVYYPVLVASDINGCIEFALVDTITGHEAKAKILPRDSLICASMGDFYFLDSSRSSADIQSIRFNIKSFGFDSTYDHVPDLFHTDQAGKYAINYILSNEYCSDTAQYFIRLSTKPSAIYKVNQPDFCAGDTILLTNESLSRELPISSFYWKDNNFPVVGDSIIQILDQGLHTFSLVAKTIVGCADTAVLDLDVKPSVFASLSRDTLICQGSLVTLKSRINNPVEGMSYQWLKRDSTLCINCLDYSLRPESADRYQFMTTHPNGCTRSFYQTVNTRLNPIKNIEMTNDTSICMNDPLPLSVNILNDVYAYVWDSSKLGLSCYTYCRNPIALPKEQTTYIVTIRDGTGCERFDSVTISLKNAKALDLGPDRTICKNDSLLLNLAGISQPRWSGASGISCTNCANPILRPIGSSLYILNALSQGCSVKDSIRINILTNDLIGGPSDTTICLGSTIVLNGSSKITSWSPTTTLTDINTIHPIAMPTNTTTYIVTAKEDLCTTFDSIRVNVLTNTKVKGSDRTVCPLDIINLTVTGAADQYQWSGPAILSGQNTSSIQIKADTTTLYKVIAKNKTCAADTQMIKVNVIDFIRLKDSVTFNVAANQAFELNKALATKKKYIYHWTPVFNLSCVDCPNPIFTGNENNKYVFSILDPSSSCVLEQKVNIIISESCNGSDFFAVPNVFTPNQDGINDILFPIPKTTDQLKSFKIFDRVGDLIFESIDVYNGWDGMFKGAAASNGVYVYLLEAQCPQTGKSIFLSGDVTLIR